MSKLKFFISTQALLFFFSFIFIFAMAGKTALACNYNCAISRSCEPPDCTDCQWCSKTLTPMPDIHNPILPTPISQLSGVAFLQKGLSSAISLGLIIGIVVFIFIFLIGAVQWITAGGDKASLESAQKTITNALIGLAILLSIFAIIRAIEFFFGISITRLNLPTL